MDIAVVILVLYLLMILVLGAVGIRRGLDEFHVAGRRLSPGFLTGTICATAIGASATLGMAGLGFSRGLPGAWWMLAGTVGLLILSVLFAGRIRASGCSTLPELVGSFYGEGARIAASILVLTSWIGVIAVQIVAAGKILGVLLGGHELLFMAGFAAVFILYTTIGGQISIVRTDFTQFIVIILGLGFLFVRVLQTAGPDIIIGQSFPTSEAMGAADSATMLIVVAAAYLVGPDMYTRLFAAKDPVAARRSAAIAAIILVPMAFMITALGIAARDLYPAIAPEQSIPVLMTELLSPAAAGLVVAAMLAGFMSSADTTLMTATSILSLDIYRRLRPSTSPKQLMAVSRISALVLGAIAFALAIALPGIIATLMIAYTIFTGGLLVPVVAGFYRERLGLTPIGAMAALIGGGLTAAVVGSSMPLMGMAISAILLLGVSRIERITRGSSEDNPEGGHIGGSPWQSPPRTSRPPRP